ncbi:MAG: hypothetical protein LBR11_10690, partial [Deltaproteobacteria bacterium]|nr:hypothetical protein [Deltaproteobacteria bacterium]
IDQEGLTLAKQRQLFVEAAQEWLSEDDMNKNSGLACPGKFVARDNYERVAQVGRNDKSAH